MDSKTLRIFIYCFIFAVILNAASITYCIHTNICATKEYSYNPQSPTTSLDLLKTMLTCTKNSSSNESVLTEAYNDTTQTGFNYYIAARNIEYAFCPKVPPGLGPVKFDRSIIQLDAIDDMYSFLKPGGIFYPPHCMPRQSVAIIIPMQFVNRAWKNYIGTFLYYIHPFLMKQLAEYQVFVIVQGEPSEPFARGKLLNAGFLEAQRMRRNGWDCLVFHDAHLVPTDTRNMYRCSMRPRRLIANHRKQKIFGGAVSITPRIYKKINGFSNLDWRNNGDYVNMYERLRAWNYTIETSATSIGKYTRLQMISDLAVSRYDTSHATTPIHLIDGFISLAYKVVNAEFKRLYTLIQVDFHATE